MTRPDVSELRRGAQPVESKQLLAQLQHEIVTRQFEQRATASALRQCGTKAAIKDFHGARFRSLFGDVELRVRGCANAMRPGLAGTRLRQCTLGSAGSHRNSNASERACRSVPTRAAELLSKLLPLGWATVPAQCALAPCTSDNAWNRS